MNRIFYKIRTYLRSLHLLRRRRTLLQRRLLFAIKTTKQSASTSLCESELFLCARENNAPLERKGERARR